MPSSQPNTQQQTIKEQALSNDKARLYMFNVGQGDHFLLKLPDGSYGILDFFYDKRNQHECPGLTYLKALKKNLPKDKIRVKFIYVSHPDIDHIKGLKSTLEWLNTNDIPVENFWCFSESDTMYFEDLLKIIQAINYKTQSNLDTSEEIDLINRKNKYSEDIKAIIDLIGQIESTNDSNYFPVTDYRDLINDSKNQFTAKSAGPLTKHIRTLRDKQIKAILLTGLKDIFAKLKIENTTLHQQKIQEIDKNMLSGIILLKIGVFKLLFAGDIAAKPLEDCIKKADVIGTDFLAHFVKGIHHGSAHSSTQYIWENILKHDETILQHVGVSAGYHTGYKHPQQKTIDDITTVTKNRKTSTHVNSTNNLKEYLPKQYKEENINWVWEDIGEPEYLKKASISNEHSRRTASNNQKTIGAYIYDFYLTENRIELKIGMTSHLRDSRKVPDLAELEKDPKWAIPFHPIIH